MPDADVLAALYRITSTPAIPVERTNISAALECSDPRDAYPADYDPNAPLSTADIVLGMVDKYISLTLYHALTTDLPVSSCSYKNQPILDLSKVELITSTFNQIDEASLQEMHEKAIKWEAFLRDLEADPNQPLEEALEKL